MISFAISGIPDDAPLRVVVLGAHADDVEMMALHGIGAAHDRDDWRAEADGVVTLVLDGLRRSPPDAAQSPDG